MTSRAGSVRRIGIRSSACSRALSRENPESLRAPVVASLGRLDTLVRAVDPPSRRALARKEERVALRNNVELGLGTRLDTLCLVLLALEHLIMALKHREYNI
jgi:hypothetical protein